MGDALKEVLKKIKDEKLNKQQALALLKSVKKQPAVSADEGLVLMSPMWQSKPAIENQSQPQMKQMIVLVGEAARWISQVSEACKAAVIKELPVFSGAKQEVFKTVAKSLFGVIQELFKSKPQGKHVIQVIVDTKERDSYAGLIGLLRTVRLENPAINTQLILTDGAHLGQQINESKSAIEDIYIKYEQGDRAVNQWMQITESAPSMPWKSGGVYLITGGMGGIGQLFTQEIASKAANTTVIITGRSTLNQEKRSQLEQLNTTGAKVEYWQVDITSRKAVKQLFESIKQQYGQLNGILHSAGVIRDNFIIRKDASDFDTVLSPKVDGTVYLDEESRAFDLDFVVLFSSGSGCTGNAGQADYATANTFIDEYASYRNTLVNQGKAKGKTLAIDWPLWASGGMQVDEETIKYLRNIRGMDPMKPTSGFMALYQALASGEDQVMVVEGHIPTIKKFFLENTNHMNTGDKPVNRMNSVQSLQDSVVELLKKLLAEVTRQPIAKIDAYEALEHYGVESFMITRLNKQLETVFGELSKTLFYEYNSIAALADYLIDNYAETCNRWAGINKNPRPVKAAINKAKPIADVPKKQVQEYSGQAGREPIAIIGLSGRYPQAKNLEEFWENLKAGKDSVTEVPGDRWALEGFYEADKTQAGNKGMSYSKWGGFMDDVAMFDPLFFSISPREAANMDPQERLFLEASWQVLEDGGYTRKTLEQQHDNRVGVFAGVTKSGYNLYGQLASDQASHFHPLTSFSSIANRVSYFLNLNGPSIPIDTMCSSSLTAIHEACEHIYQNTCDIAIAGGVNLYLHPSNYTELSRHKMLSEDGRCKSFGKGGNGFVPGEGVGCVLLKPLSKAIADNDNIYGVIRGTSINHGGKTSGYTVPNPVAQSALISDALDKAGVNAREVSYIEAHGTGTELGDPIEVTGLTQAFANDTADTSFCALGSAKSNIGHLEAAAGIAGVTKILLQMKHKQLVPTLHVEELNPNINFAKTPFVIQKSLSSWEADKKIAGISSFGAGGANAHIVIEAYEKPTEVVSSQPCLIPLSAHTEEELHRQVANLLKFIKPEAEQGNTAVEVDKTEIVHKIIALIAGIRDVDASDIDADESFEEYGIEQIHVVQLQEALENAYGIEIDEKEFVLLDSAHEVADFIVGHDSISLPANNKAHQTGALANLAYTLQVGREAMAYRAAFEANSLEELSSHLQDFLNGNTSKISHSKVKRSKEELQKIAKNETWQKAIAECLKANKLHQLAGFWINGIELDWSLMYDQLPQKISLPTYPFNRKKYWVPDHLLNIKKQAAPVVEAALPEPVAAENVAAHQPHVPMETPSPSAANVTDEQAENFIKQTIIENLSQSLDLEIQEIDHERSFADYGLDSILGVDLIHSINETLTLSLETIKLFDYSSVNMLSKYILNEYGDTIKAVLSAQKQPVKEDTVIANTNTAIINAPEVAQTSQPKTSGKVNPNGKEPIAIVGMSGRFAGTENLEELWQHISNGHDLVEPVTRWDLEGIYNGEEKRKERYCNGGSFVKDIDKFDPLFFNISGVEANHMDPQQRIFLEETWKALEDAGYAGNTMKGTKTGVYVGSYVGDYQNHFSDDTPAQALWGTMGSVIPSRIAYYLDFKGPAISVDTSCSSSLVAIHLACKDLWAGETEMALAGGVFIQTTPRLYTFAEGAGMLSPDARCKTFDNEANGFVPGEGAGVIVMKRLSEAVEAGDHIYGVIQGSGLNQDGTTNGITAPSANSQERLLTEIYNDFEINPEHIQMVEAHGTGTKLGDPIEFSALDRTFKKFTNKKQFSALGSIKTNIGHSQYAAGVAGVLKILLSLKYGQIPPSLHYKEGNKAINFADSPFFVNTQLRSWKQGEYAERNAVVSSFGASGTNAHIVISEAPQRYRKHEVKPSYTVPLSAKSEEQLKVAVQQLLQYCTANPQADLGNISNTLTSGRKHLSHRWVAVASNINELTHQLQQWSQFGSHAEVLESAKVSKNLMGYASTMEQVNQLLSRCNEANGAQVYRENLKALSTLFVQGADFEWSKLYSDGYEKVALPTYPFARDRYWVKEKAANKVITISAGDKIHPFLHINTSGFNKQEYRSTFSGQEFFLKDHQVKNITILPGVAYMEMARAAVSEALGNELEGKELLLKDVVWMRPVEVQQPTEVKVNLTQEQGNVKFEIHSAIKGSEEWVLNSQGTAVINSVSNAAQVLDLQAWQNYCNAEQIAAAQCYDFIRNMGIQHGPSLQSVQSISVGNNYALAKLQLPQQAGELSGFVLHPSLLDAAIQASMGLFAHESNQATSVPFGIDNTTVVRPCTSQMWALIGFNKQHVAGSKMQKLDIDLFDDQGRLCVKMEGYTSRVLEEKVQPVHMTTPSYGGEKIKVGSVLLRPVFDGVTYDNTEVLPKADEPMLLIGGDAATQQQVSTLYPQTKVMHLAPVMDVAGLAQQLQAHGSIKNIFWKVDEAPVSRGHEAQMISQQESGVLLGFKLIKALLQLGYDAHELTWTIITKQSVAINAADDVNPAQASVHGLVGALAKEYPNWKIRMVDVAAEEPIKVKDIMTTPFDERGNVLARRNGAWHKQLLLPIEEEVVSKANYKQNGVYVIIGGAGGIGQVWTDYMIRNYNAQVIWLGRSIKDQAVQAKLDALASLGGPAPVYITADAGNEASLTQAYNQIKQQFGQINGVVHSAIVLLDQSLAKMDESRFRASLDAKVNTSIAMAQVFGRENLDFVMFFSSIQSFAKAPGQSNYAAGCTFKDAFADYLRKEWSCPVKVMNWGYWGSVGIVASQAYNQRMAQAGLASIEAPEAMAALETLLASGADQLALSKGTSAMQVEGINLNEQLNGYPQQLKSYIQRLEQLTPDQTQKVSAIKAKVGQQVKEMDGHLVQLLYGQLQAIGMFRQKTTSIASLKATAGLPELYDRWFEESLTVMQRSGLLTFDETNVTVADTAPVDMDAAWRAWEADKQEWIKDPNRKAQTMLVEACVMALPEILTGKKQATDIIFPNSSMKMVEGVYKNNAVADYFNDVLSDTLVNYVNARLEDDPNAKIKILEIGAGTGGTSAMVFPKLRPYQSHIEEYCYTDLSKAFLLHAKREYGPQNPYLDYQIFNVEKPLEGQNIEANKYDVIIATNVLHATKNISNTMQNAKAALKKHGIALLNELSDNVLFSTLTFGLLKGWWLYDDPDIRISGSPGLYPESWKKVLENVGYQSIYLPTKIAHDMGQAIIVAESDGIARQKTAYDIKVTEEVSIGVKQAETPKATIQPPVPAPAPAAVQPPKPVSVAEATPQIQPVGNAVSDQQIRKEAVAYMKNLVADVLQISPEQIQAKEPLESYGIDSILVVQITTALRKVLSDISSTLFFEIQTINGLVDHFMETQKDALMALLKIDSKPASTLVADLEPAMPGKSEAVTLSTPLQVEPQLNNKKEEIAIVGLAGQYPDAENVEEFWQNLKAGKNCISEVPEDRWNWEAYFDAEKGKEGKIYSKWGGFMKDIDKFDPLFFKISPMEAEKMDPQERLFLQTTYASIEDAGYVPENLCESRKVGVFAGVMNNNYPIGAAYFSIANRISYLLNFSGPSMAVDTACSSSLTAIHLAVESLQNGSCEVAIAGGVNLIVDPYHYQKLSELTMLSADDTCKSFGANADGFVDGEGVGAIVLKPLSKAIQDGDHVYGVIKSTAINAGGKTSGYTVPSPKAQAEVIADALEQAKLDARTISYIEAHGTGTALGDPIEVAGLSKAFTTFTQDKGFCAIGSVKSNIGHAESAAGIAGLTKILLQMKYKQLAPSLHANTVNPEIDFSATPFSLQHTLAAWNKPVIQENGGQYEIPRRAGLSSFGAGGANAHIIVEEYDVPVTASTLAEHPHMLVLSAKSEKQLKEQASNLIAFIRSNNLSDGQLTSLAYTLQVGRVAMDYRLSFMADTMLAVTQKLQQFLNGDESNDNYAHIREHYTEVAQVEEGEEDEVVKTWAQQQQYDKIIDMWSKGLNFNWQVLYTQGKPARLSLPTYPFAKERYWMESRPSNASKQTVANVSESHFDQHFYDNLFDDVIDDTLSIEAAIKKIQNLYNN